MDIIKKLFKNFILGSSFMAICTYYYVATVTASENVFKNNDIEASAEDNQAAANFIDQLKLFSDIFAAVVLSISILTFIYAGLCYILTTKVGNSKGQIVKNPSSMMMYAAIGIVVALSSFAIARMFASFGF